MDYSLLLGLHDCEKAGGEEPGDPSPPQEDDGSPVTPRTPAAKRPAAAGGGNAPAEVRQLGRSNTPFRRSVLERASSAGDYGPRSRDDDGFARACEAGVGGVGGSPGRPPRARRDRSCPLPGVEEGVSDVAPPSPPGGGGGGGPPRPARAVRDTSVPNPVTSRPDSGILGLGPGASGELDPSGSYGTANGALSTTSPPRREIYFCGIIDILQYYSARKMGETVMRRAAGNGAMDISCVDPETYGKRFVKFVSSLIEEE